MPATGDLSTASAIALLQRGDLRVGRGHARAGGGDFLAAARRRAAGPGLRRPRCARSRAACTRAAATSRRVAASSRCLREPAFDCEQRLEALEVGRRRSAAPLRPPARPPAPTAPAPPPGGCPRHAIRPGAGAAARRPDRDPPPRAGCASSVSAVSSRAMRSPAFTRSPSATFTSRIRPPTSGATRTSVASM